MKNTFLSILFLLISFVSFGQFPVQISPQLISPYSLQLSEYYNGTSPKLIVTLTNQDLLKPQVGVRLRMTIKGQSVEMRSKNNVYYPTIFLDAGIPTRISLGDLAPYFNIDNLDFLGGFSKTQFAQSGKIPEGFYEFCFEAIEVTTGQVVSRKDCSRAWISLSEPPLLSMPANTSNIEFREPSNIIFSWTPRHLNSPNSAFNTEYEFQMVELWDNAINPQAAFQTAQPLYQVITSGTTVLYGPLQPLLIPGKRYAWRVKVQVKDGSLESDVFKNNGFSEIYWFRYMEKCVPPTGVSTIVDNGKINVSWVSQPHNNYVVDYKENIPGTAWVTTKSNIPSFTINNLSEGKDYSIRVGGICTVFGMPVYGDSKIASIPPKPPVNTPESNTALGKIFWAYHKSVNPPAGSVVALLNQTLGTEATTLKTINNEGSNLTFPLKDADVKLVGKFTFGMMTQSVTLGTAKTLEDGSYKINLLGMPLGNLKEFWLEVSHSSKLLFEKKRIVSMIKTSAGYQLGSDSILAKSVEFNPRVFVKDNINASDVVVEILLQKDLWLKNGFMKNAGLGTTTDIVRYNNQDFIIVAKLANGNPFNKLFQNLNNTENYLARIMYNNTPSGYFPLASMVTVSGNTMQVINATRFFELATSTQVEGIVSTKSVARRDVKVSATIAKLDILGLNNTQTVFETVTDATGAYRLKLPLLKEGATITIQAVDKIIRIDPFVESVIKAKPNTIIKNFDLVNPVMHVLGRLVDVNGVAISNAMVNIDGETQNVRTNSLGFYSLKTSVQGNKTLKFTMDAYESVSKTINTALARIDLANPMKVNVWETKIKQLTTSVQPAIKTPEILNIGAGQNWANSFNGYFFSTESLQDVLYAGVQQLKKLPGKVEMNIKLNGKNVKAKVSITALPDDIAAANQPYIKTLNEGKYTYSITSVENDSTFLPFFAEVVIEANKTKQVSILLKAGTKVTGKITNKVGNGNIDSAVIVVKGLPYKTISRNDGTYDFIVPRNESLVFSVSRSGFDTKDSSFNFNQMGTTVNISLKKIPIAPIKSISGFKVSIDKQEENGGDNFKVSGKLFLVANDIFAPNASKNFLTFKDAHVVVNRDSGTAIALYDINFEEAVITAKAFGFAPVEITGFPQIQLRALKDSKTGTFTYDKGIIGGEKIKLLVGDIASATKLPINLSNAGLTLKDSALSKQNKENLLKGQKEFQYAFTPDNFKINALRKAQSFGLEFKASATASFNPKFVKGSLGNPAIDLVPIYINKEDAELNEKGLSFSGLIQFPRIINMKMVDSGRVEISKFTIGTNFEIAELTVAVSKVKPLKIAIQKLRAEVTSISLFGLGTSNFGIGVGGHAFLKKATTNKAGNDTLFIKEFSINNTADGLTVSSKLAFGAKGFSLRSLVFNTGQNQFLGMSYNRSDKSFEFEASGTLSYDSTRTAKASASSSSGISSAMKKILPIEIQTFKLKSKDWSFLLVAKADIKIDFKVAKINVEKLLVSVGKSDMDINALNSALIGGTSLGSSNGTGGPDDEVDETATGWAFGIIGGVSMDVKSIKADASTSLLVANLNDKVTVIVNEINLKIDAPAFDLAAKAKMSFAGDRRGFEAEAKIITKGNKQEFEAGFKFYSLGDAPNSGIEIGAKLKASVKIITGPVMWHSLGGGFDFNTQQQTYQFMLMGDVSPAGTPKEAAYMAAKLEVLFDVKNCGAAPVITGSGTFFVKEQNWGNVTAKLDFCKSLTLITVAGKIPAYPGVDMHASGVFYGMTEVVGNTRTGSMYVGVNVNVDVLNGLLKGNAFFATGVNYKDNHPNAPAEIKKDWSSIPLAAKDDNGNTLNGVYMKGTIVIPDKSGDYGISIAGIPLVGFSYGFGATGNVMMYYKYKTNTLRLEAKAAAYANAKVSVLSFSLNGNGNANINIEGGYNNGAWYANGNGNLSVSIANGSGNGLGCNSSKLTWSDCCCTNIGYPCGAYWWGVRWCNKTVCLPVPNYAFKVCANLSASFDYKQGKPLSVSIGK